MEKKSWSIRRDFFLPSKELAEAIAKHHNSGCNCRIDGLRDYMPALGSPLDIERVRERIGGALYDAIGIRVLQYTDQDKDIVRVEISVVKVGSCAEFAECMMRLLVAALHLRVHQPSAAEATDRLLKLLAVEFLAWLKREGGEKRDGSEALLRLESPVESMLLVLDRACIEKMNAPTPDLSSLE